MIYISRARATLGYREKKMSPGKVYKNQTGDEHRHKKHRQTGDTTLKKGGSQLNYLDLTQTMARKLGR